MKLIIQIPCYNEAETLPLTLAGLPRAVPGFDEVEWLLIDDGSTDDSVKVALSLGVDHIIQHKGNKGLARTFMSGLEACLCRGAQVIVNTDADNQYNADDIPALTRPILNNTAELVIGFRPITTIDHFSATKKLFQKLGSWVVRVASNTRIPDTTSGFRAISRNAAQRLMVFNDYTYTLETIIQAGRSNISIDSVPIRVNKNLRPSRLVKSIPSYIKLSIITIIRIFVIYRPFRFFGLIGCSLFSVGFILGVRFLMKFFTGDGDGHVQSLQLASILMIMGFQTMLIAFVADLQSANRKLLEEIRYQNAKMNFNGEKVVEAKSGENNR